LIWASARRPTAVRPDRAGTSRHGFPSHTDTRDWEPTAQLCVTAAGVREKPRLGLTAKLGTAAVAAMIRRRPLMYSPRSIIRVSTVGLMVAAMAACAPRPQPEPIPEPGPSQPTQPSQPGAPTGTVNPGTIPGAAAPGSVGDFQQNVGDRVYFDLDSYSIRADAMPRLDAQAQWLNRYPNVTVRIEGNADERGTREYNLALG